MKFFPYTSGKAGFQAKCVVAMAMACLLAATGLRAQSAEHGAPDFGDIKSVVWKPTAELTSVIDAEKSRMAYELSNGSLAASDRALFTAFDQLLALVKTDAQAGSAVDEAIVRNYDIVLLNAKKTKTPDLSALNPDAFLPLALTLIESLQKREAPVLNEKF